MSVFIYTALKGGKEVVNGNIQANSLREAREALREMNLIPTKLEEKKTGNTKKTVAPAARSRAASAAREKKHTVSKLSIREKIDFTNILYYLSKTGIPLIEALLFIEMNAETKNIKALASEIRKHVIKGLTLSDTVSRFPKIFDRVYVGLIKAGEETGELDSILARIKFLLDKQDKLRGKVIGIMIYPAFIVLMALGVTTVMLTFVFPAFKDMYSSMGNQLPFITSLLIDIGTFLKQNLYVIPLAFGALFGGIYGLLNWRVSRRFIDGISLKIPVFRTFVQYAALANFITVFRICVEAGLSIVDGLMLSTIVVKNEIMRDAITASVRKIQHGQSLSNSLKMSKVMPGVVMCMISTGEESGQLEEMLELCGSYIDAQLESIIDTLSKLMEPLLLLVIGGLVLVLALALYLPLFQGYSNIG